MPCRSTVDVQWRSQTLWDHTEDCSDCVGFMAEILEVGRALRACETHSSWCNFSFVPPIVQTHTDSCHKDKTSLLLGKLHILSLTLCGVPWLLLIYPQFSFLAPASNEAHPRLSQGHISEQQQSANWTGKLQGILDCSSFPQILFCQFFHHRSKSGQVRLCPGSPSV